MNKIQMKEDEALINSRKTSMVVKANQVKKALSDPGLQASPEISFNPFLLVPWQDRGTLLLCVGRKRPQN